MGGLSCSKDERHSRRSTQRAKKLAGGCLRPQLAGFATPGRQKDDEPRSVKHYLSVDLIKQDRHQ
jgi:hypothetical protein